MKRKIFLLTLISGMSIAWIFAGYTPAVAGGGCYSNRDLNGEYIFNLVEVRTETFPIPGTNYCDHTGVVNFDGVSAATVTDTRRCSLTGLVTEAALLTYSVNCDGSLTIDDPADPNPVHGQIVNRGHGILLDGTTRTNLNSLIFHGIAVQR